MSYPPEPWELHGQLHASAFLVPLDRLTDGAPLDLPPGCRLVRLGGRAVVGTAWVVYEPTGVLDYRELMATVLVRRGWRILPTIVRIWVDSEESRDGGRALWGIPKELAGFDVAGGRFAAADDTGPIAAGTVRAVATTPFALPLSFRIVQWLHGRAKVSPVRSRARLALSRARFDAEPAGPLAFLTGRRPLVTVTMRDFRMRFGG
ncbi:acetoacetate decarboxylase family protein [uncultured Jatrophihabitans sp.]|uniref:acetoacetate decarboxylase family protein n=1 Tax=uncultured Jatrophihabitans sp. TaxID=1610747 RepID=UPI0035CB295C